jgi:hypothetical protein
MISVLRESAIDGMRRSIRESGAKPRKGFRTCTSGICRVPWDSIENCPPSEMDEVELQRVNDDRWMESLRDGWNEKRVAELSITLNLFPVEIKIFPKFSI